MDDASDEEIILTVDSADLRDGRSSTERDCSDDGAGQQAETLP